VGAGVRKILQKNSRLIEKRRYKALAENCRHRLTNRGEVKPGMLTRRAEEIMKDRIDIVMELIGGIGLRNYILKAIRNKSAANKVLALHGDEIFKEAHRIGVDVNFEASVGGGIPLIRSIKEGLVANRIQSIFGILNGTSNYILSKMTDEGRNFKEVLKEAQEKGYAEADPTYDIEGIDAAH
jgi:homoserine dehydrogenase